MKISIAISTPSMPLSGGQARNVLDATYLIASDWDGFGLDFLSNTYAVKISLGAERLLGETPALAEPGLGLDMIDNSFALGIS